METMAVIFTYHQQRHQENALLHAMLSINHRMLNIMDLFSIFLQNSVIAGLVTMAISPMLIISTTGSTKGKM